MKRLAMQVVNRLLGHESPCLRHVAGNHLPDAPAPALATAEAQRANGGHVASEKAPAGELVAGNERAMAAVLARGA